MNAVYTARQMKRRYEVWFLRCGLADGSGAWWFRYLLMNLGRRGCNAESSAQPVQVWATWFPRDGKPQTFIQGYSVEALELSPRRQLPFHLRIAESGIEDGACWGDLRLDGHAISWKLRYRSDFGVVLSDKGWIGFGVQGHNCGYRHRTYWRWMHTYFPSPQGAASTLEALVYDLPFGLVFRKAVLWHRGHATVLRNFKELEVVREAELLRWRLSAKDPGANPFEATIEARAPGIHQLPYLKTDCSGTFPVSNASIARATLRFGKNSSEILETMDGAVLEMAGA
jgi:hypothetical protein